MGALIAPGEVLTALRARVGAARAARTVCRAESQRCCANLGALPAASRDRCEHPGELLWKRAYEIGHRASQAGRLPVTHVRCNLKGPPLLGHAPQACVRHRVTLGIRTRSSERLLAWKATIRMVLPVGPSARLTTRPIHRCRATPHRLRTLRACLGNTSQSRRCCSCRPLSTKRCVPLSPPWSKALRGPG
jgi:hypothetical protein